MTTRGSLAAVSHVVGGIALAALLQLLVAPWARAEKLPAGCGKYAYYECATEGKASVEGLTDKTIHRWHRPR